MITKKLKGFTIIELIVVIAIIAVLSAIVLVNVTSYIAKSKDASIKGNMTTVQTNAAAFYDQQSTNTYVGFSASSGYTTPTGAMTGSEGGTALHEAESVSAYCVSITLNAGTYWCTDNTGYVGAPTASTTCASGHIACQ